MGRVHILHHVVDIHVEIVHIENPVQIRDGVDQLLLVPWLRTVKLVCFGARTLQ